MHEDAGASVWMPGRGVARRGSVRVVRTRAALIGLMVAVWAKLGAMMGVPCGPTERRPPGVSLRLKPSVLTAYLLDLFASFMVFVAHILTFDTVLSACIAMGSVLYCYNYGQHITMNMNFSILSIGVVFPISLSISQAFARREVALRSLLTLRGFALAIFCAHRTWNWDSGRGRDALPADHVASVRRLFESFFAALEIYCLLPRGGHARFNYTCYGVHEAAELQAALDKQCRRIDRAIGRLNLANEAFKLAGLPATEASRCGQYVQKLVEQWELIRSMKEYRTPAAMRAFARVYILVLPVLFAPYLVHVTLSTSDTWPGDLNEHSRVAFACGIAATVSVMLAGLFSVELSLENPFSPSLDAIRVQHELTHARESLARIERDAAQASAWLQPLESDEEDIATVNEMSCRRPQVSERSLDVHVS